MNSSTARILIACLWIASLGGAYLLGRKRTESSQPSGSRASVSGATKSGEATFSETDSRRIISSDSKSDHPPVKELVLQARAALGTGMSNFMNMRGMFKALAPLTDLSEAEVKEALAEVEQTVKEPQQKMMFYSMLLSQWAESDGPAAMAYAKEKLQGQGPMMAGITMSVAGSWARRDPEGVWRWYLDARERGERGPMGGTEGYLAGIFSGMAAANVDAAFGRLGTLAEHERPQAIAGIAMSGMDPRVRESLLTRVPSLDAATRGALYQSLIGSWMMTDADGATKWMGTLPEEERKPLVSTAGSTMMFMNPEKGAELQIQNATEKELPQTYSRVVSQWAQRDPQSAGEWLNRQPQGPQLDDARRSFAVAISGRDPAGAYDWVKAMQDENKRIDAYRQIYKTMESKNPANANTALEQAGLPSEVTAKIRAKSSETKQ